MEIYTIGFTKKSAAEFFGILKAANVAQLVDVRLNNTSQLAGFAKKEDLEFFLRELDKIEYVHEPLLAPSEELFEEYKKKKGKWEVFETGFLALMRERQIESALKKSLFKKPTVLLCSEPTAACCHRRLVVEYLRGHWGGVKAVHL